MKFYQAVTTTLLGSSLAWLIYGISSTRAEQPSHFSSINPSVERQAPDKAQEDQHAAVPGQASVLVADYQMRDSLNSSVGTAPALTNLGSNAFESATIDDSMRRMLSFDPNNGVALTPTDRLVTSRTYTIVMLFSLSTINDYRRLIDFKNGASNRGLYCYNGRLVFLSSALEEGGGVTITPNNFVQVALTRNSAGTITGYLNGVRQLSFTDREEDGVIDASRTLRFFRDNAGSGEASAGQVVRLRIYNEALSGSQIAALDRLPNQQASCPSFSGFNPASGQPGASFLLNGSGLNGVTGIKFGNLAAGFTINDETQLSVTVPGNAVTQTLTISKPGCGDVLTSAVFTVSNITSSTLAADYQFQDSLRSAVNAPPALTTLGATAFESVGVDNAQRRALRFDQNNGAALFSTAGVVSNQAYTVVMLFALGRTNDYRRLIEFKNGTNNKGLYVYNDRLVFLGNSLQDGFNGAIKPNTYVQVALTRDSAANVVAGYVNGAHQFSFVDSEGAALIEGNALRFFRDNAGGAEASEGHVARIRLFNVALSSSEIAALDRLPAPQGIANVSAASFTDAAALANESIVSAFGTSLAIGVQSVSSLPLPTTLAGTTVKVKDNAGAERPAPLFFVAPTQVNYLIPSGTSSGSAMITITSGDGTISAGAVQIATVAPGLFSANANGQGVAAAIALRVKSDGSQLFEAVARFDPAQNRFIAAPIDLGPATDQVFLLLFGTGWRFRSNLSAVTMKIGGADAAVSFAGPQSDFVGLDQLNVPVPRALSGRGEVDITLTVDGKAANTVRVSFR